ncbi:MAG: sel1 repeat family protein [Treponema sp.]|uniref:tetratricopeptide repeat protein n=1 Tax=Treponema sp. TaxID=166 RepID=UPI0025D06200|nr:tetratricopeptide repeat protein [Treponema sp.]MBQ8679222.1 sel1 repeat family protein [Treponema sp.]
MKKTLAALSIIFSLFVSALFAQTQSLSGKVSLSEVLDYALGIDEWTKIVRSATASPLTPNIPVDVYMRQTKSEAFIQYKNLADSRSDDDEESLIAKCAVAYCYYYGIGAEKDEDAARAYLEQAAQKDFAPALNFLGFLEDDEDKAKALEYYARAAEKNYVTALYNLSAYYLSLCDDDEVTDEYMSEDDWENYHETAQNCLSYLEKIRALHLDDENILFKIAVARETLYGKEDAKQYYIEAAENGNADAMQSLRTDIFPKYTDERAKWRKKYYEALAEQDEKEIRLAKEKLPYLLRHAENGDMDSMHELYSYYRPYSLFPNWIKAFEWKKKAADAGNGECCHLIAGDYAEGNVVQKNLDEAICYYEKALERGAEIYSSTEHDIKKIAFCTLKVNGFINRVEKSQSTESYFFPKYDYSYFEDYESFSRKNAFDFVCRQVERKAGADWILALAYCHYLGSGCEKWERQKVEDFLKENGLAETIALLPFDEDEKDPNSEKYKEERANYIEEKNAEIAELEKRADKNDLIATFELALEYNSESDTESRKKAFELFSKTVYIFDNVEYEYVSEEDSWKRLEHTGEALYFLGKYLNEGRLEDANPGDAAARFMQGMFYGNDSCAYELARLCERGYWDREREEFHQEEYKQDIDFALRCYQVAAKKGNWLAKSALENYNIKVEEDSDSRESDDDDYFDEDDSDDDESSAISEGQPPVTDERLQEILAEIVERENQIVTEEERDDAFEMEDYTYLHANGNTFLIDSNETLPYYCLRLSGDEKNGIPKFIIVAYKRATKKNMRDFCTARNFTTLLSANEFLKIDMAKDLEWIKSKTLTLHTKVKIGGEDYEVMFTDLDGE